jgi:methionyl-tRNA formyltransferase
MRVVIVTRILPVALGFYAATKEAGHEPVALLTIRDTDGRYGSFDLGGLLNELPAELSILMPARRADIAPLLDSVRPDLVVCMGFPWKIPAGALAVPSHGWLNGHPSLLPRHRGPVPIAWAIREGDTEIGITFHRMDSELDTGPIMAQTTYELGEYEDPDVFYPRMGPTIIETLRQALDRLAAGDEGAPQAGEGTYESLFTDDDALLDFSRSALELHRLVWAWRYTIPRGRLHGALAELDGETVRVLESSLSEAEGARRVECADGPLWLVKTEPVPAETQA